MTTKIADKPTRAYRHWTLEELDYLKDNYGLICDKVLAARLQRSEGAIIYLAVGKHLVTRQMNFYTASALASLLGIPSSKSILLWVKKRWLSGIKSAKSQGKTRLWRFSEYGVAKCLRKRPWLVVLAPTRQWLISDYSHPFFYIVRKEWERDPWYTCEQAAPLLGRTQPSTVYEYIHRGWLRAEKKPCLGSTGGMWIIRLSAIRAFLANDPRPQHQFAAASASMKRFIVSSGEPSKLATIWVIRCPSCGQQVRIEADPQLHGPQVRERFIELYVNGNCTHGGDCLIETYPIAESRKEAESNGRDAQNEAKSR